MVKIQSSQIAFLFGIFFASFGISDTFQNKNTGEIFDGYPTLNKRGSLTQVRYGNSQSKYINLANYDVTPNAKGRKNKVFVLSVTEPIELSCVTEAFEKAIISYANQGPLFILIEIDTPGGRVDYVKRMCEAILKVNNCMTVAFITGGKSGGALSGGAALALACNRIYMAEDSIIGAATMLTISGGEVRSVKEAYGHEVGEKMTSAWRAYMRSLAEANGRSGAIAGAMVDKDIEVIQVESKQGDKRYFVDSKEVKEGEKIINTLSKKGKLLTLTANEAYDSFIADKIVTSRKNLFSHMNVDPEGVILDVQCRRAKATYEKIKADYDKSMEDIDLQIKRLSLTKSRNEAYTIVQNIRIKIKSLIRQAEKNEDLGVDPAALKEDLRSIEAIYEKIKQLGPD